jgi:5-formyltetrahydrofolate cyclo-ligase
MKDWNEIKVWRVTTRKELLEARAGLPEATRRALGERITRHLVTALVPHADDCIGFYWPIRGEIDLRSALHQWCTGAVRAALPVVVAKDAAMIFRPWHPAAAMTTGVWDIPIPATEETIAPTVLLIPLVGFDDKGYRLGYGGGFYDRTLAGMTSAPLTIGIGLASSRLPSVHPQPHDIPLAAILTEEGWARPLPATEPRRRG